MTSATIDISTEISDIYDIVNNTFVGKDKGEKHAELEVEIGDIYSDDFQPQFKIKRWDNECNFSVRLLDDTKDVPKLQTKKNKIEFVKEKTEAHFYDVPKTEEMPEGCEFEIILKEKPVTNKVQMSIETKGLAFYYQPELTQEEKDEGSFRPENVVGSYAVYHESKAGDYSKMGKKNYRAGKAFHIFRPRIIDNAGKEVWGKLNIDVKKKLLTVEIPQEFLDNAIYPIIVDPTFGYETVGGSSWGINGDELAGQQGTPSSDGRVESISIYATSGDEFKPVLVLTSDLTIVTDGVGNIGTIYSADDWYTATYTTNPQVTGGINYIPSVSANAATYGAYDSGSGDQRLKDSSNSFTTPIDPTDGTRSTAIYSIYCTYTAGGGLSMAVVMHHLRQQRIS